MRIINCGLQNFRNHKKLDLELGERTIILGINGSGKSNILEAMVLCAVGKSFRADSDDEMVKYGTQVARVKTGVWSKGAKTELEVVIHDGSMEGIKKRFLVNGVSRRSTDFAGNLRTVVFSPMDMDLLSGSPSGRRRYLDMVISQKDREYRRCLISYEKGIRQRNKILEKIREGEADRSQLFFWDRLLIKNGNYMTDKRSETLDYLSEQQIEGGTGWRCVYDKSEISEARLAMYSQQEIFSANTLVGPHRDDFFVEMTDEDQDGKYVNVAKYASRGEQRMAILWLKKGEFNLLNEMGDCPVLLLDDVFSELDHKHRVVIEELAEYVAENGGQVIMTAADEHLIPSEENWSVVRMMKSY